MTHCYFSFLPTESIQSWVQHLSWISHQYGTLLERLFIFHFPCKHLHEPALQTPELELLHLSLYYLARFQCQLAGFCLCEGDCTKHLTSWLLYINSLNISYTHTKILLLQPHCITLGRTRAVCDYNLLLLQDSRDINYLVGPSWKSSHYCTPFILFQTINNSLLHGYLWLNDDQFFCNICALHVFSQWCLVTSAYRSM